MSGDNDSSTNNPQEQNSEDWLKAAADWWSEALSEAGAGFRRRLDRDAKRPRKPAAEPVPPTDFDRHFQEHVPAKLEPFIRLGAYMVRLELEEFSTAHDRVMRVARKYGALHLSDAAFFELDSWIDRQLLACIDEPPPDGVVTPEQLARIVREAP